MRRIVVGTAGHIDHGKTSLVRALTGIDCDRWVEEKERGITIDLGFAFMRQTTRDGEELQIGFVDVPGHERFVHNALAGLGGIRLMILVVAADEGVKPQTREHLDICSLLEIPAGLAVLTKSDLVSEDLLELAELELEEALRGGPFEGAPILTASSTTGEGIAEVKTTLVELARRVDLEEERPSLPTRLPIDRAFHLKGMGVVVTGTLMSGSVRPGDSLSLLPAGQAVRVRSVQVHGVDREVAVAGERTSLQLGGIELASLARGMQLTTPDLFATASSLLARFTLLESAPKPIKGFVPVRFHLTSTERVGKLRPLAPSVLEPGATGLVEIRLDGPIVATRGDRFIIRRPSPQVTLGGGIILDPAWKRPRGKALGSALDGLGGTDEEALVHWVSRQGEAGAQSAELARLLGRPAAAVDEILERLTTTGRLLEAPAGAGHGRRFLTPTSFERIAQRARRVLREYFERDRLSRGMPKAEAVERILPGRAAELADVYLLWLERDEVLTTSGDLVNPCGRESELTAGESKLASAIVAAFETAGLTPPSPESICTEMGAKRQIFDGVLRYLIEGGRLVRLPGGLVLPRAALDRLRDELLSSDWQSFSVARFKDRYGLTRKWAIPLLEYLDQARVTRRVGDERQILRPRVTPP